MYSREEINKMPREHWFSVEKYWSDLHKKMESLHPWFERYYHFRCWDARIYWWFWWKADDWETIYILHIDSNGDLWH